MIIQKGFKYRIYPNQFQQSILAIQFGHSRFVYNHFLQVKQNLYKSTKESLSYYDTTALLVELKKEFEWLKQAGSQGDTHYLVRINVACSPLVSAKVLVTLLEYEKNSREPNKYVIRALYKNTKLPYITKIIIETLYREFIL